MLWEATRFDGVNMGSNWNAGDAVGIAHLRYFYVLNQSLTQLQKAKTYVRNITNADVWLEACLQNRVDL